MLSWYRAASPVTCHDVASSMPCWVLRSCLCWVALVGPWSHLAVQCQHDAWSARVRRVSTAEAVGCCPGTPHLLGVVAESETTRHFRASLGWLRIGDRFLGGKSSQRCRHGARCGVASSLPQGSPPLPSLPSLIPLARSRTTTHHQTTSPSSSFSFLSYTRSLLFERGGKLSQPASSKQAS